MLGIKKKGLKEGAFVFATQSNGKYNDFIVGAITGMDGKKIGINGNIVNPIGL